MRYRRRTFWIALTEWLKWRPKRVIKKCRMCGREWVLWTTEWYYTSDICSVECEKASHVDEEEWGTERDRKE